MSKNVSEFVGRAEIVAARFGNQNDADIARLKLENLGYDPRELSFISDATKCSFTFDGIGSHGAKAAADGIVGGGAFGAALGAGATVLGAGGLVLLGPIGLVTGVVLGGVSGLLLGLGLSSDQATACEEAVNDGSVVMTVQAHAGDSAAVRSALGDRVIAVESDRYFGVIAPQRLSGPA
jgi:uncharacterized membrane protein